MVYMEELNPDCDLGLITSATDKAVTIHWFHEKMNHELSPSALHEGIDGGVYEVIGVRDGKG